MYKNLKATRSGSVEKPLAFICLGAGTSQLPLIERAKAQGYRVIAIDRNPAAKALPLADVKLNISTYEASTVVKHLVSLKRNFKFLGVLARTTASEALMTAAAISREFSLPGLTPELVQIATSKSALRCFSLKRAIPFPRGCSIHPSRSVPAEKFPSLPLILKPDRTVQGKAGITVCSEWEGIEQEITRVSRLSANGRVEVEHFIEGLDVTCACLADGGKCHVIAFWDELVGLDREAKKIVALGLSVPSVVEGSSTENSILRIASDIVRHHPCVSAILLLSFRVSLARDNVHLVEIHADLGGDYLAEILWPEASETSFFDFIIEATSGKSGVAKRVQFRPVLLTYGMGLAPNSIFSPFSLIRGSSNRENLERLQALLAQPGFSRIQASSHLQWLEQYSSSACRDRP